MKGEDLAKLRNNAPQLPNVLLLPQEPWIFGRGSWIRTNDLQYPKLPRYQAALYPEVQMTTSIHA